MRISINNEKRTKMSEFQLTNLESTDISGWNFEQVKEYLATALERYDGIIYADEASAKADKKELSSLTKMIEDRRKAYKKQCLQPYEELEPQIKALLAMIEERQRNIDGSVKVFEEKRKASRESEIKAYYDTKAVSLGALAEPLYKRIFSPKWLNVSTAQSKYEKEIMQAISTAVFETGKIRELNSPMQGELLERYINGADLDTVLAEAKTPVVPAVSVASTETSAVTMPTAAVQRLPIKDGYTAISVKATARQLDVIRDFLTAIGVEHEIL